MEEARTALRLWTRRLPDGGLSATWLLQEGAALALVDGQADSAPVDVSAAVPVLENALFATFARYGRALEERISPPPRQPDDAAIELVDRDAGRDGGVALVRAFRFRAMVDVEPTDYLVLERPGKEPVCAPANMIAPALAVVSRAAARAAKGQP